MRQLGGRTSPRRLTVRLSDVGFCRLPTKLIYPDHLPLPWLTEDGSGDRSSRLSGIMQPSGEVNNALSFLKVQRAMHCMSSGVIKQ
jgi:hypothetical protein